MQYYFGVVHPINELYSVRIVEGILNNIAIKWC